jgi:hypothetical protein
MATYVHIVKCEAQNTQVEAVMIRVKVEYDAYNRTFKLRDREFGSVLEDGVVYELDLPIRTEGLKEEEAFSLINAPLRTVL